MATRGSYRIKYKYHKIKEERRTDIYLYIHWANEPKDVAKELKDTLELQKKMYRDHHTGKRFLECFIASNIGRGIEITTSHNSVYGVEYYYDITICGNDIDIIVNSWASGPVFKGKLEDFIKKYDN